MIRTVAVSIAVFAASVSLLVEASQRSAVRGRAPRTSTAADCAAELGVGVASSRRFCDVILTASAADSITVKIPPHRGAARLLVDLHNRVAVPHESLPPAQMFVRNTAVVAVVGPKAEIARGVVDSEFRKPADLFDRVGGGAGGGAKAVAPGLPTPLDVTIPAGVTTVGLVGVRLEVLTRLGKQTYDMPGRPIAIASNLRVEYTPR